MNAIRVLFSLLFLLLAQTALHSQIQFNYRYGSHLYDKAEKVIESYDKRFLIAGYTKGFGSAENGFLLKTDGFGNPQWMKHYPAINSDLLYDMLELPDYSLVMTGSTTSYSAFPEIVVMKTDSSGNTQWAKRYNAGYPAHGIKIVRDNSTGFYVAGYAQIINVTEGIFVLHLDSAGGVLWANWAPIFGSLGEWSIDVVAPASGGAILLGTDDNTTTVCCWKFSSSGAFSWSKAYSPSLGSLDVASLIEKPSGDFAIGFCLNSFHGGDMAILTIDTVGNVLSFRTYGGTLYEANRSLINTPGGGLLLCGITNSAGNGDEDHCLIKVDPSGNVQWARAYGSVWAERGVNVTATYDGGYALTGQTYSFGSNPDSSKIHLLKTDSLGYIPCNGFAWTATMTNQTTSVSTPVAAQQMHFQDFSIPWSASNVAFNTVSICGPLAVAGEESESELDIYPNPFSSDFSLVIPQTIAGQIQIEIRNLTGQIVYSRMEEHAIAGNILQLHAEFLSDGIYFLELNTGSKKMIQKIIKN